MKEETFQAVKLFIFLLLIFGVFAHWIGDNGNSRLDLTVSIVERGELNIDPYRNNTLTNESGYPSIGDRVYINGHYYSEKAPLSSFLAVPSYALLDIIKPDNYTPDFYMREFKRSFDDKISWARYLSVVTVSGISGAFTGVLLFLIFLELGLNKTHSLGGGIAGSLSTLVFPYSTTMHGTMLGTSLFCLALYFWIRADYNPSKKKLALISGIIGLGVTASYLIIIPGAVLMIITAWKLVEEKDKLPWKNSVYAFTGLFTGLLPLAIYNTMIFGHPFDLTLFHMPSDSIFLLYIKEPLHILIRSLRTLFDPVKGFFIYSPIMFFGLYGLKKLETELKYAVAGTFILILGFTSALEGWLTHTFFGARYLLPASVMLFIPAFMVFIELSRKGKMLFFSLLSFSTLTMISSTQPWISAGFPSKEAYLEKMFTAASIDNNLFYYLGSLTEKGLQSPILSYLLGATDSFSPVLGALPSRNFLVTGRLGGITTYGSPLIYLSLIAVLGLVLFRRQIKDIFNQRILRILIVIILLITLTGFSQQDVYRQGFYPDQTSEYYQWGRGSPDIYFFNDGANSAETIITFEYTTIGSPQQLNMKLNDKDILNTSISEDKGSFSQLVPLEKGLNHISFRTSDRCRVRGTRYDTNDTRCVSVGISNFSIAPGEKDLYNGKNIYPSENYFDLQKNATFYTGEGNYSLGFKGKSIGGDTEADIFINGKKVDTVYIDSFGVNYSTPYFNSENKTKIRIDTGCPSNCENIQVSNISVQEFKEQSKYQIYDLGRNWYPKLQEEEYSWSTGNSTIYIYNYRNRNIERSIWIEGTSFGEPRTYSFHLNGKKLGSSYISELEPQITAFNVQLKPGENILRLASNTSCLDIGDENNNSDIRCASFGLQDLQLEDRVPHLRKNLDMREDFEYEGKNLVMSGNGTVDIANVQGNYSLSIDMRTQSDRVTNIKVYEGDELIDETKVDLFTVNYTSPYREIDGRERIRLVPECNNCSINIERIGLNLLREKSESDLYDFGRNWYQKNPEKEYRMSAGNSSLYIFNHENKTKERKLWVIGRSIGVDRVFNYRMNGERLGTREVTTKTYRKVTLPNGTVIHDENKKYFDVILKPGVNTLHISSPEQCREMGKINNNNDVRCAMFGLKNIYMTDP